MTNQTRYKKKKKKPKEEGYINGGGEGTKFWDDLGGGVRNQKY